MCDGWENDELGAVGHEKEVLKSIANLTAANLRLLPILLPNAVDFHKSISFAFLFASENHRNLDFVLSAREIYDSIV